MRGVAESAVEFESVLERLRSERLQHFAAARVTIAPRRVLIRPFSQVMEVDIEAEGRATGAFVKILKPREEGAQELEATRRNIAREFEMTAKVHAGFASHHGLSTARPIACYPDLLAMVTERVDGVSLQSLLARARGFPSTAIIQSLTRTMRGVGAWLRAFQRIDTPAGLVSLDQLRTYLDKRLKPLADGGVIAAEMRSRLLHHFDSLAAHVPVSDLDAVPVHADFTPENVIIHDDAVVVLDFTMAKPGARHLDLSHMWLHVNLLQVKPWFRPAVVDALTAELLAGYDPSVRIDHPLFQLLLQQHVICYLSQLQQHPPPLPGRVYAELLRRRYMAWLTAQTTAASAR